MKKLIYSILALGLVTTSCTKSDLVEAPQSQETLITFSTYNGKIPVTRAGEITNENIENLNVVGFLNGSYSTDEPYMVRTLTKEGSTWTYSPLMYWPYSGTLDFVAYGTNTPIAASGSTEAGKLISSADKPYTKFTYTVPTAVASQQDLIVCDTQSSIENGKEAVTLNVKHLLSKVGFKLQTVGSGTTVVIKSVELYGDFKTTGIIDLTKQDEGETDVYPMIETKSGSTIDGTTTTPYSLFASSSESFTAVANNTPQPIFDNHGVIAPETNDEMDEEEKKEAIAAAEAATAQLHASAEANRYMMIMPCTVGPNSTRLNDEIGTNPYMKVTYVLGGTEKTSYLALGVTESGDDGSSLFTPWTFEAGKAYEFIFKVSISEIKFTGTMTDWDGDLNGDGKVDEEDYID